MLKPEDHELILDFLTKKKSYYDIADGGMLTYNAAKQRILQARGLAELLSAITQGKAEKMTAQESIGKLFFTPVGKDLLTEGRSISYSFSCFSPVQINRPSRKTKEMLILQISDTLMAIYGFEAGKII